MLWPLCWIRGVEIHLNDPLVRCVMSNHWATETNTISYVNRH